MSYFNNVWKSLPSELKKKSTILFILILISTCLEVLGIGLIVPVVLFFIEDDLVLKYPFLHSVVSYFFFEPNKIDYIKFGLIILLGVYFIKNSFLTFFAYYESKFVNEVRSSISNKLFKYYLCEELAFHNKMNSAHLINNLTKEILIFSNAFMQMIIFITEIFVFSGIAILLLYYQPKGFLIVAIISFVVIWTYNFFTSQKLDDLGKRRQVNDSLIVQKIQQGLGGLREIKIYNRELGFFSSFKKSILNVYNIAWLSDFIHKIPRLLLEFASVLSLAAIVLLFINFSFETNDIIVILGLFALAAARMLPSLSRIYNAFQQIKFGNAATQLISNELVKFDKKNQLNKISKIDISNTQSTLKTKSDFNLSIKVENLSFSYYNNETKIFDKINFEIKKGQLIGIKGPSGSGKSTLADILLGLLSSTEGKVLVDNRDIFENLLSWQKKASYVPQSIFLTDDKLSRNIALGIEDEKIDKKKLEEAVLAVELDGFVNSLPSGLDTIVGERGSRLSGGQKQRIGLARALYNNPRLLVLDETTNSLDKETEKKIIETILKIKDDKTIIFISHDKEVLKNCDLVYTINNKKVYKD